MSTKSPNDYEVKETQYEWIPTGGIQDIAEKPFTVNHIDSFTSKGGTHLVIVNTDETFSDIEYKPEDAQGDEKVKGDVSRFFASPRDIKKFFSDPEVIKDVNENGNKIRTMIKKVPFTAEKIARSANLKGKTHYVFVEVN